MIQQTFWIFCAVVTGQEYQKSDFADNVYTQYKDNMGTAVSTLPEERRQQIDAGIDDFWDVFQATGVEAKVISIESPGLSELISDHPDLAQASPPDPDAPPAEEGPAECDCDSLTFVVSTDFGGLQKNSTKQKITEFSASKNKTHKVAIELDAEEYTEKTTVNVSGITLYCTTCRAAPCHPHAPASDGKNAKMTDDTKDKILVSGIDTEGASETPDTRETSGSSLSMTVTPDTKAANYFISFKISGTCMAPEPCKEKKCIRYIQVEVKAKKKEK